MFYIGSYVLLFTGIYIYILYHALYFAVDFGCNEHIYVNKKFLLIIIIIIVTHTKVGVEKKKLITRQGPNNDFTRRIQTIKTTKMSNNGSSVNINVRIISKVCMTIYVIIT